MGSEETPLLVSLSPNKAEGGLPSHNSSIAHSQVPLFLSFYRLSSIAVSLINESLTLSEGERVTLVLRPRCLERRESTNNRRDWLPIPAQQTLIINHTFLCFPSILQTSSLRERYPLISVRIAGDLKAESTRLLPIPLPPFSTSLSPTVSLPHTFLSQKDV